MFPAAEKVSSLGKDWHKFCLKCERCNKTLTPGGHAEVRAAGTDGVRELCCHAGVAWWSLQGSPAPQGWRVPGIGWGRYPMPRRWAVPVTREPRSAHCSFKCCCCCDPWCSRALVHSLDKPQSGAGTTCGAPAVPPQCGLPGSLWQGSVCPDNHLKQLRAPGRLVWASHCLRPCAAAERLHQSVFRNSKNRGCMGCHGDASSALVLSVP